MNKFIKRICTLAVTGALMATFAGCGSNGSAKAKKTADGKVVIEYWYGLGGKLGDNMEKIIDEFNASQDKYEVKGVAQEDYKATFKNLQAAISAKKTPALALLEADKVKALSDKKTLTDLNKYMDNDSDYKESDYLESFVSLGKNKDGGTYGFPIYGTTQLLYYNKQAFKDAGVSEDSLKTWTGFKDAAAKLTKKDGDDVSYYGWEPMWGPDNLVDVALSNGGRS